MVNDPLSGGRNNLKVMLMRRVVSSGGRVFFGVLAVFALGSIGSAQTEDAAKGASLLAEARRALGGEDKLAAVKRLQVKGEMRRGQGNLTLEGDTEVFLEPPDKFRRNESLSLGPGGPGIDRVEAVGPAVRTATPIQRARRASTPSGSRNCSCEIGAWRCRVCSSRSC